jgi:hypothetical protein
MGLQLFFALLCTEEQQEENCKPHALVL